MTIYIQRVVNTRIYRDATKADPLYAPRDAGSATQAFSTQQRFTAQAFSIAIGGVPEAMVLGDVGTVKSIHIEASGSLTVVLNGTITIPLTLVIAGAKCVLDIDMQVTSITLANAGTAAVTGELVVWGDPTA